MLLPHTLIPAHRRAFTTKTMKQHLADWCNGLEMKIEGGPYCSNRDLPMFKEQGHQFLYFQVAGKIKKVAI